MTTTTPATTPAAPADSVPTVLRNGDLTDLVAMLRSQQDFRNDVIAPSSALYFRDANLVIAGSEPVITPDGVTSADGTYRLTDTFIGGLAGRLNVPTAFLRRMAIDRPDVFDMTGNLLLRGSKLKKYADGTTEQRFAADARNFLVRTFTSPTPDGVGLARAFLSDKYGIIDNLDVLMAALDGATEGGIRVDVDRAHLSETHMYVRLNAPEIAVTAPALLHGYRSPFTGQTGEQNPVVSAGIKFDNSEVGAGAFNLFPELKVEVCGNGLTITTDAVRKIHIGSRQDEGIIRWSADTINQKLEVIKAETRDAVKHFLNGDYVRDTIAELERAAGVPVSNPQKTIEHVGKELKYSDDQIAGILSHFIQGGQVTAGGVMQAVTSFAQTVDSADAQANLEASAVRAMQLVAAAR